ncbi:hypothetical protein ACH9EU_15760 [Kocuria sp. M1R5S2]|uniref:hypothetical protein n=1 Tax=Kocuria rhizosphaerae TaxID=3376285 RepID=UPI00379E2D64
MPKLGEVIGALLTDAVQARMQADLEAVRIAEAYSRNDLLKHLPVPRFRLPEITVDLPVLVTAVGGLPESGGGPPPGKVPPDRPPVERPPFEKPPFGDVTKAVNEGLKHSGVHVSRPDLAKVSSAAFRRAKEMFESGDRVLLDPDETASTLADVVAEAVRAPAGGLSDPRLEEVRAATTASLKDLIASRLVVSMGLQVRAATGEIKSHGHNESVMHLRLTITEDAYEVVARDDGHGYYLTPE